MKNKKGFTLVELLSVIAILAILVIIALPNILTMFNNAKKNTFETEAKTVYTAAEEQWISDTFNSSGTKVYSHCESGCNDKLSVNARDNLEYYIEFSSKGDVVKYYITDGNYQFLYEGTGLKKNDIKEVEFVPNLPEAEQITINEDGYENGELGRKIDVCLYTHYDYYLTVGTTMLECYTKQTIADCLGINSNYTWLYKTELSNPGEENILSCYQRVKNEIGTLTTFNTDTYNGTCSNNSNLYIYNTNSKTDFVLPETSGCYTTRRIYLSCLDGDTEVEVYDKKKKKRLKKKLKDLTYDDLVLAWDFDKGEYVWVKPLWIMKPVLAHESTTLKFSDGSVLKVVGDHRIYDTNMNKFVSAKESDLGLETINSNGEKITLVEKGTISEEVYAYNVITERHINLFANGILTSQGSNNIYEIVNMKFVKEERERFTKEEIKDIPLEYIEGLRLEEWIIDDKGNKEETLIDMHNYIDYLRNNKK